MTINRSVQKRMRSLEESGYGRCGLLDEELTTSELYVIELEDARLSVYRSGFAVKQNGQDFFYRFDEVLEIVSCLTAELCSRASADQNINFSLPLKVRFEVGEVVLHIPFLAYSRILNVLADMWNSVEKRGEQ